MLGHWSQREIERRSATCAIACCHFCLPDTASSDTCAALACCIMLVCTHLLGSCHQQRQDKEICRCAECARTALIASYRFLVCTLAYVKIWFNPAHSLSSFISYAVVGLGADHRCARALRYLRAMRLQQEFSIRTFIRCLFAGTVRPSAVSCILYQSTGTS